MFLDPTREVPKPFTGKSELINTLSLYAFHMPATQGYGIDVKDGKYYTESDEGFTSCHYASFSE